MRSSIRSRLVALVRGQWAGLLALFLVIAGGTAYAANTVFSGDIVDGQVKTADLANDAVRTGKVLDESLTGHDIQDDTIGGADVNESLLSLTAAGVVDESLTGHDIQDDTIGGADVNESLLHLTGAGVSTASFSTHDPFNFALPGNSGWTQVIDLLDGGHGGMLDLLDARVIVNGAVVFRNPRFEDQDIDCRARIAVAGGTYVDISRHFLGTIAGRHNSSEGGTEGGELTLPITGSFDVTPGSYNVQVECRDSAPSAPGFRPVFENGDLTAVAIAR